MIWLYAYPRVIVSEVVLRGIPFPVRQHKPFPI